MKSLQPRAVARQVQEGAGRGRTEEEGRKKRGKERVSGGSTDAGALECDCSWAGEGRGGAEGGVCEEGQPTPGTHTKKGALSWVAVASGTLLVGRTQLRGGAGGKGSSEVTEKRLRTHKQNTYEVALEKFAVLCNFFKCKNWCHITYTLKTQY